MNELHFTPKDINGIVSDLIRQMWLDGFMPDYVIGITRGGLVPAQMISHYLDIPMHTLKVSMRDDDHCESNLWMAEDAYSGKNILIIDDINDSGKTLQWIKEDWETMVPATNTSWQDIWNQTVRFSVLVANEASKFDDVDYIGKTINKFEEPCWVVFPWEEWWK